MKPLLLFSLLHFLTTTTPTTAATHWPGPIVPNAHGSKAITYRGIYQHEIEGFISIRYAHSTAPPNRFKRPIPYTPAAGSVIDVTEKSASCPQRKTWGPRSPWTTYDYVTEISEDCLFLNVWRPNGTRAGDKLPVLVYIYGGSFITGNKDGQLSQPGGMQLQAIDNGHPVMNVEMNYRLGAFGFAQTDHLIKTLSTNAGLRDQRLALEWVHANIASFGGDPDKITIHGQSSGGLAVGMQIMAYGGKKAQPFQQAICESQALEPGITGNSTRRSMARVWETTTCAHLPFDSAEAAACLGRISMRELLHAQLITHTDRPARNDGDNWLPVVDGDFVPAAPSTLLAEGRFYNVSAMIGWTDNDAVLFTPLDLKTEHDTYHFIDKYLPGFTEAHVRDLLALYPPSEFQTTYFPDGKVKLHAEVYRCGRIFRDILFTCQPIHVGHALASAGNNVYFYDQNQTMLGPVLHHAGLWGMGVVHTSELLYVFGNLSKFDIPGFAYHPSPSDFKLRDQESRSWSSFTAVGRPSLPGHDTLAGWEEAEFPGEDGNYGVYVIGGPTPGYSGRGGDSVAKEVVGREELGERCGFLNRPGIVKELLY